jgi:hypothetical protein
VLRGLALPENHNDYFRYGKSQAYLPEHTAKYADNVPGCPLVAFPEMLLLLDNQAR